MYFRILFNSLKRKKMQNKKMMQSLKDSIKSAVNAPCFMQEAMEDQVIAAISASETKFTMNELNELYNYAFSVGAPCIRQAIATRIEVTHPSNKIEMTIHECIASHRYAVYPAVCA